MTDEPTAEQLVHARDAAHLQGVLPVIVRVLEDMKAKAMKQYMARLKAGQLTDQQAKEALIEALVYDKVVGRFRDKVGGTE